MAGPDKFDPTMMLGNAKNMHEGSAPSSGGEVSHTPADVQQFDGAATSAQNIVWGEDTRPLSTDAGYGGPPAGVDKFNGGSV